MNLWELKWAPYEILREERENVFIYDYIPRNLYCIPFVERASRPDCNQEIPRNLLWSKLFITCY